MIPEDLERQISLAEAEVSEGPSVPSGKVSWLFTGDPPLASPLFPPC